MQPKKDLEKVIDSGHANRRRSQHDKTFRRAMKTRRTNAKLPQRQIRAERLECRCDKQQRDHRDDDVPMPQLVVFTGGFTAPELGADPDAANKQGNPRGEAGKSPAPAA